MLRSSLYYSRYVLLLSNAVTSEKEEGTTISHKTARVLSLSLSLSLSPNFFLSRLPINRTSSAHFPPLLLLLLLSLELLLLPSQTAVLSLFLILSPRELQQQKRDAAKRKKLEGKLRGVTLVAMVLQRMLLLRFVFEASNDSV